MAHGMFPQIQLFLFETSFDPEEIDRRSQAARLASEPPPVEAEPPPPPEPTFSEEEIAQARAEAFAAGLDAGRGEAMASIEREAAEALRVLSGQVASLVDARKASDTELIDQTAEVALTMVRKMLPELLRRQGLTEVEAVVRECLAGRLEEPRIVIRVCDALLDVVRDRVADIGRSMGYEGAVVLLADPKLGPADVKVEWAGGGAGRLAGRPWAARAAAEIGRAWGRDRGGPWVR